MDLTILYAFQDGSHNLSMIEKSKRKKKIDKYHEGNLTAGSIIRNDRQLHRTGVRGRKIVLLVVFLVLLVLLCLVNLIVSEFFLHD